MAEEIDTLMEEFRVAQSIKPREKGATSDPLASLDDYLKHANDQNSAIERVMIDAFDRLIAEVTVTRDNLARTLLHNRQVNDAAVAAVRSAGDALGTLSAARTELSEKFDSVLKTNPILKKDEE